MKKIGTLLLILAVIWAVPGLRLRATAAALPVLEKLGPAADFVVTPAREFGAKTRATNILRLIANDYNEGRQPPHPRDFRHWVDQRMGKGSSADPWGRPYWLSIGNGSITVGSDGVDRTRGTADDVKHTIPF